MTVQPHSMLHTIHNTLNAPERMHRQPGEQECVRWSRLGVYVCSITTIPTLGHHLLSMPQYCTLVLHTPCHGGWAREAKSLRSIHARI